MLQFTFNEICADSALTSASAAGCSSVTIQKIDK